MLPRCLFLSVSSSVFRFHVVRASLEQHVGLAWNIARIRP
ncbi:putative membrane protein [Gluconacetobacter diazotrophicus PA1 5]|uniref:Putative membrane protein n=1 Tax=Gluconacetobacter diazotrophicus (strain ATCC 49037 / DSM 5601 / CCUG 37298 / CIP 103539 / LMG 7603 / PAl5) TaxID=272568 RepID=A9HQC5_GLUDA|nr:putative membrane protein [Gluconacetobacter diazotrophicus PA1 5]